MTWFMLSPLRPQAQGATDSMLEAMAWKAESSVPLVVKCTPSVTGESKTLLGSAAMSMYCASMGPSASSARAAVKAAWVPALRNALWASAPVQTALRVDK
jgi:hypothetical protein